MILQGAQHVFPTLLPCQATSQLSLFLSQFVTKDKETLDAVRRYARASMAIVFLKRKFGAQQLYKKLDTLVDEDILFPDEVNLLRSYNNNLAESIWTWVAHIVADLNEKGKIKGEVRNDEKTQCTKSP